MRRQDHPLHILMYARRAKDETVVQIVEQLEKIATAFHGMQIDLCARKGIWIPGSYIKLVEFGADVQLAEEPGLHEVDLVLIEGLDKSDLEVVLALMVQQIPVLVEEKVAVEYGQIFIPGKSVESYSHSHLVQLPMTVTRFLRQHTGRKQIVDEARAMALMQFKPTEGILILKEATLTCEHSQRQGKKRTQMVERAGESLGVLRQETKRVEDGGDGTEPASHFGDLVADRGQVHRKGDGSYQKGKETGFVGCGVLHFGSEVEKEPDWRSSGKVYRRCDNQSGEMPFVEEIEVVPGTEPEATYGASRDTVWVYAYRLLQKLLQWGRRLAISTERLAGRAKVRKHGLNSGRVGGASLEVDAGRGQAGCALSGVDCGIAQTGSSPFVTDTGTAQDGCTLSATDGRTATGQAPYELKALSVAQVQTRPGHGVKPCTNRAQLPEAGSTPVFEKRATALPTAGDVDANPSGPALGRAAQPGQKELQSSRPRPVSKSIPSSARQCWDERVDLVIVSYNTLQYLRECVQSIRLNTHYPYRIIVVDNGSTDGSVEYLRRNPDILLIANRDNLGYAKACNQGILAGKGEFVVLLNTDIKVFPGWLKGLIEVARRDEQIGVVGPKMINEWKQIVGAGVTRLNPVCNSRGWLIPDSPERFAEEEDCYSVGGACYLIRRDALTKTGLFDERFFFYFEESDLSLRMVEKGYRVVYTPHVSILHHHEGSLDQNSRLDRLKRNRYFEASQEQFLHKWAAVLNGEFQRSGGRDIVVFGLIHWHFRYQRPQQICTRLAEKGYRVLYINNTCQYGGHLETVKTNLYVYSPDGNAVVYRLLDNGTNRMKLVQSIQKAMEELGMINPVLWVDAPYWQPVLRYFDRQYLVYNCMDAYADFPDLRQHCPELQQMEEDVVGAADLVIATSRPLHAKLQELALEVHLIHNGAECRHFQDGRPWRKPTDLVGIPEPVCGYYGAIAEWLDLNLLRYVVERLPHCSFVLLGEQTVDVSSLRAYSNVYFLGEKAYAELPVYLQHFQVAMIPFKVTELTWATNPVKLYEYLAAGKPVVSVDLPEVRKFAGVVQIARDAAEFVRCLTEVLGRDSREEQERRKAAVVSEDWDNRVQEVCRLLRETEERVTRRSRFQELARRWKEGNV